MINKKTYGGDLKKIGFFLSFMNEGDAASWKEQLLEDAMATAQANNTKLNLRTFAQFKHNLEVFTLSHVSPEEWTRNEPAIMKPLIFSEYSWSIPGSFLVHSQSIPVFPTQSQEWQEYSVGIHQECPGLVPVIPYCY